MKEVQNSYQENSDNSTLLRDDQFSARTDHRKDDDEPIIHEQYDVVRRKESCRELQSWLHGIKLNGG